MHTLLKPKYFIPVHGEYRHLKKHAQLSEELGLPDYRVIIPDIGDCIELTSNGMKKAGSVPAGSRLIDGEGIEGREAEYGNRGQAPAFGRGAVHSFGRGFGRRSEAYGRVDG